ncbi:MAG: MOSC domain-containing protein [Paracoccus sp. (in: a-proteobacteria)]|nr:MOSC domain-containing protein [Paracoccus sp. (in: a-proteobacteria)]
MTAHLAHIRRHPIKSVGGEALDTVTLTPGCRLPGDRQWAVLTEAGERHAITSQSYREPDRWLPKTCFMRGAAALSLQSIKGGWQGDRLTLEHPHAGPISVNPDKDGPALIDWLRPLWPASAPAPTRLVQGAAVWTDQKWPWISILSLDSLADLERRTGRSLGIHRWRGNLWIASAGAWTERNWIGRTIRIGKGALRVNDQIRRCDATSADTNTGLRDGNMVETLDRLYGHTDFGVFAEIVTGGEIRIGDEVTP